MADFSDNGNSGCFYKMLRRISCFRSLPTHPADHILESKTIKSENQKENPKAAASPGIVARLMGLDSLPDNNWVSRKGIPDSVVRSRSVNFVDYLLEFDLSTQAQHRRVRTSVSFREVPTLSQQQNRDVLVVRLNDGDETKGMRSKVRKSEMGFGEMKQRKEQSLSISLYLFSIYLWVLLSLSPPLMVFGLNTDLLSISFWVEHFAEFCG